MAVLRTDDGAGRAYRNPASQPLVFRQNHGAATDWKNDPRPTSDHYQLIESKLPIFAKPTARRRRYYLSDNFLESWLAAISPSVAAREFRPQSQLIAEAVDRLQVVEGKGLERLAGQLY